MSKPIVAIIGRQNVGKSTLLNRVVGKPAAIVEDLPGTTRDRIFADTSWHGVEFTLVDTGGLETKLDTSLARGIREQTEAAVAEADVIVFLADVKDGLMPTDMEIADLLRRAGKSVVLVANKADSARLDSQAAEFNKLGFAEPLAISAQHGRGVAELLDKVVTLLPGPAPAEKPIAGMKVAIVGRPNVGKSMLLNALVGEERVVVDEIPGTTRDAIDTKLDFEGQSVLLIDTAGIRRRGRVERGVEWYSVIRALRAIDRADVVLLVLDATELVAAQDTHIAGYVQQAAKGIILIVNKWDLVANKKTEEYTSYIQSRLKFVPYAPVLYVSAKLGQGVKKIMPLVSRVYQERLLQIPDEDLNNVVREAVSAHVIPRRGKKELKILQVAQSGVKPPTFFFLVNDAKLIHFSYQRYLQNRLRQVFGFIGTPVRLIFKTKEVSHAASYVHFRTGN